MDAIGRLVEKTAAHSGSASGSAVAAEAGRCKVEPVQVHKRKLARIVSVKGFSGVERLLALPASGFNDAKAVVELTDAVSSLQ